MIILYNEILEEKLGGKIYNLMKIKDFFNIPKGFIITEESDISDNIFKLYENNIGSDFYICRSSMNNEDSLKLSYAGLFESIEGRFIDKTLLDDIKEVFDSLNNDFLDEYEIKVIGNKIINRKMNVIVQEFIVGEVSGVYFSNLNGGRLIEYIKGCNQFLVDGVVKSNKLFLDKNYNEINHEKNIQYKYIGENLDVFIYDMENDSLSLENKNKLILELKKLSLYFDYEIDVEWTIKKGVVYILQVRPITR